jgi:transcription antitermination factor NusG
LPLYLHKHRIKPLFPRYLMAQADLDTSPWRSIYQTHGVVRVLSANGSNRPAIVPEPVLDELWQSCAPDGVIYPEPPARPPRDLSPIPPGAPVVVETGSLSRRLGVCLWSDERRVRFLMQILGGDRPVTAPRAAVATF